MLLAGTALLCRILLQGTLDDQRCGATVRLQRACVRPRPPACAAAMPDLAPPCCPSTLVPLTESRYISRGFAKEIATAAGGRYHRLPNAIDAVSAIAAAAGAAVAAAKA